MFVIFSPSTPIIFLLPARSRSPDWTSLVGGDEFKFEPSAGQCFFCTSRDSANRTQLRRVCVYKKIISLHLTSSIQTQTEPQTSRGQPSERQLCSNQTTRTTSSAPTRTDSTRAEWRQTHPPRISSPPCPRRHHRPQPCRHHSATMRSPLSAHHQVFQTPNTGGEFQSRFQPRQSTRRANKLAWPWIGCRRSCLKPIGIFSRGLQPTSRKCPSRATNHQMDPDCQEAIKRQSQR